MLRTGREIQKRHAEIHAGRLAFNKGKHPDVDCPHPAGSDEAAWWQHGWVLEQQMAQLRAPGAQFPS